MRALSVLVVIMMFAFAAKSQSMLQSRFPFGVYNSMSSYRVPLHDSLHHSKWSFSKYASLSTGYTFFKGGSASFVAAPAGIQLNRQLNNNLYAFAGVSAAPTYLNFRSTLLPNDLMKTNAATGFMKGNSYGMYSKAELGLMYTNDARTFSISGSIGVERNSTPVFYSGRNATTQNPVYLPNK